MDIFLSYVIPCYNVAKYLPKCIESLREQNIPDHGIEFIMVNDGSPDNSLELLEVFAGKDGRVVIVNQENQGVSAARNNGFSISRGKYVLFLDGDDFLTPNASNIILGASKNDADIIITNAYQVRGSNLDKKKDWNVCPNMPDGDYETKAFLEAASILPLSIKAYKSSVLRKHNIVFDQDLKVGEVFTFFLHALQYAKCICFSSERTMNYVLHGSGAMRKLNMKKDRTILTTISRMDEYASGPKFDLRDYSSYNASFFRIVRIFTLNKYASQTEFSPELGSLLKEVSKTKPYRKMLKHIILNKSSRKRKLYAIGQLLLPTKMYFSIMRFLICRKKEEDDL